LAPCASFAKIFSESAVAEKKANVALFLPSPETDVDGVKTKRDYAKWPPEVFEKSSISAYECVQRGLIQTGSDSFKYDAD
jgi:hypothetical protein